jgi:hypothetical protein
LASDCGDQCPFVSVFSRHLVLNLFPFPLTPAQLLSDGLPIKGCAAKCWQHFTFKIFFCLQHHYLVDLLIPPPISKEIYTSCWEGVGIAQRKIDQFNISEKIKGKDDFLSAI